MITHLKSVIYFRSIIQKQETEYSFVYALNLAIVLPAFGRWRSLFTLLRPWPWRIVTVYCVCVRALVLLSFAQRDSSREGVARRAPCVVALFSARRGRDEYQGKTQLF